MLVLDDQAGGNGAAVELEVTVGLVLAVQHERDRGAVPLRRGIAPKAVARGDLGPRGREVELERDCVDEKRRRAVVESAPNRGADGARKHHSRYRVISLPVARRRRSAWRWAGSRRRRRARRTPSTAE